MGTPPPAPPRSGEGSTGLEPHAPLPASGRGRDRDACRPDPLLSEAVQRLETAGIERAVFEAQLLLALAAGASRTDVLRGAVLSLTRRQAHRFQLLVAERCRRVPLAYLRGTQEFYGLEFEVTPAVLVPRPDTELLVELILERLRGHADSAVIDVGTGTGCIAISAARHRPNARFAAADMSADSLAVAYRNIRRHEAGHRILLVRGDMLEPFASGSAAMIVSNPPYIPSGEIERLQPEISLHEPRTALDGGPDGLDFYRRLAPESVRALRPGGLLAVEVGQGQADAVACLLRGSGLTNVESRRDLAGIERVVIGAKG